MKLEFLFQKFSRREFLKLAGLAAGVGLLAPLDTTGRRVSRTTAWLEKAGTDPQVEFNGRLFRGTRAGAILASDDAGLTWKTVTILHDACPVTALGVVNGWLAATLDFQGHSFLLHSAEGRIWQNG